MQHPLRLGLEGLGQLIEPVGRLVHPAALDAGGRPPLRSSGLEAQGSVTDGQGRGLLEAAGAQVQQQLPPGLRALPKAVRDGQ